MGNHIPNLSNGTTFSDLDLVFRRSATLLYLQKCFALFVDDSWVSCINCFMQYSHWISSNQEWIWQWPPYTS